MPIENLVSLLAAVVSSLVAQRCAQHRGWIHPLDLRRIGRRAQVRHQRSQRCPSRPFSPARGLQLTFLANPIAFCTALFSAECINDPRTSSMSSVAFWASGLLETIALRRTEHHVKEPEPRFMLRMSRSGIAGLVGPLRRYC